MPRGGNGMYTLPQGNPVTPGTVIESAWANTTLQDIATQLNNVVTRDGLLGPEQPIQFPSGTQMQPSITFSAESGMGFYRRAQGELAVVLGGEEIATFTEDGFEPKKYIGIDIEQSRTAVDTGRIITTDYAGYPLIELTDSDDLFTLEPGYYAWAEDIPQNAPVNTQYCGVVVRQAEKSTGANRRFICVYETSGRAGSMYVASSTSNTFGSWHKVLNSSNISDVPVSDFGHFTGAVGDGYVRMHNHLTDSDKDGSIRLYTDGTFGYNYDGVERFKVATNGQVYLQATTNSKALLGGDLRYSLELSESNVGIYNRPDSHWWLRANISSGKVYGKNGELAQVGRAVSWSGGRYTLYPSHNSGESVDYEVPSGYVVTGMRLYMPFEITTSRVVRIFARKLSI